jgi:hypothetical protein
VTSERCVFVQGGCGQDVSKQFCMGLATNWEVLQSGGPTPDTEDLTEGLPDGIRPGICEQQDR